MGVWAALNFGLLAAGTVTLALSIVWRRPNILMNMVLSDADLTGKPSIYAFLGRRSELVFRGYYSGDCPHCYLLYRDYRYHTAQPHHHRTCHYQLRAPSGRRRHRYYRHIRLVFHP
jgi:hypothetical protein